MSLQPSRSRQPISLLSRISLDRSVHHVFSASCKLAASCGSADHGGLDRPLRLRARSQNHCSGVGWPSGVAPK
jgi:hypothetical protein